MSADTRLATSLSPRISPCDHEPDISDGVHVLPLIVELAHAVEDRLALVDLDAAQHVRTVRDEHVGAVVHRLMRELDQEVRRLILEQPLLPGDRPLVAVAGRDQELGQVLAVAHAAQVLPQVALVHLEAARPRRADLVPDAEELHAVGRLRRRIGQP